MTDWLGLLKIQFTRFIDVFIQSVPRHYLRIILFLQCLNLVRSKTFPTLFERPKLVNEFLSYVSAKKVGRSGTYTLALIEAFSLTTASWLCHRRVIRVAPDMLPQNTFSLSPTVLELGAEICSSGRQTITIRRRLCSFLRSGTLITYTTRVEWML